MFNDRPCLHYLEVTIFNFKVFCISFSIILRLDTRLMVILYITLPVYRIITHTRFLQMYFKRIIFLVILFDNR